MNAPLIVAVDDDPALLSAVERELRTRYSPDYRICILNGIAEARATFEELAAADEEVALVLAAEELGGAPGAEFLGEVGRLFPHTERALLIDWGHLGDPDTGDAIFEAIARGRIDYYVVRPAPPPDGITALNQASA